MSGDLTRLPGGGTIKIGTSESDSVAYPTQGFAGMILHVPSSETPLTLAVWVADEDSDDASYHALKDSAGNAASVVAVADDAIELPAAVFAAPRIKVVAGAISAGTTIDYKITQSS